MQKVNTAQELFEQLQKLSEEERKSLPLNITVYDDDVDASELGLDEEAEVENGRYAGVKEVEGTKVFEVLTVEAWERSF